MDGVILLAGPAALPLLWGVLGATLLLALIALVWHGVRRRALVGTIVAACVVTAAAYVVAALWVGNPHTSVASGGERGRALCASDSVTQAFPDPDGSPTDTTCQRHARERVATGAALWLLTLSATAVFVRRRGRDKTEPHAGALISS